MKLNKVDSLNKALAIIALSTIVGTVTYAWTGPTGTAPSNNTPAPINVGSTLQEKLGSLNVRGAFTITGGYKGYSALTTAGDDQSTLVTKSYVDGKSVTETDPTVPAYVKDGTDWTEVTNKPTIPSQGITSISGGNCSAGQVVKSISSDGTATCGSDTDPTVIASVKDGVSWSEVTGKPTGFSGTVVAGCGSGDTSGQYFADATNCWGSTGNAYGIYNCPSGSTKRILSQYTGMVTGGLMYTYICIAN